jgi:hypothetical protein
LSYAVYNTKFAKYVAKITAVAGENIAMWPVLAECSWTVVGEETGGGDHH